MEVTENNDSTQHVSILNKTDTSVDNYEFVFFSNRNKTITIKNAYETNKKQFWKAPLLPVTCQSPYDQHFIVPVVTGSCSIKKWFNGRFIRRKKI